MANPTSANTTWQAWWRPVPELSVASFYGRCLWIVVRIAAAYIFANEVSPFFYQQF